MGAGPRKWMKIILTIVVVLVLLVFAAMIIVPRAVGPRILAEQIERNLGMKAKVGGLSLSPAGTVRVRQLEILNPAGTMPANFVEVPSILVRLNLRALLSGKILVKEIVVDRPSVTISGMESLKLGAPAGAPKGKGGAPGKPPQVLIEGFEVKDAHVAFTETGHETSGEIVASVHGKADLASMSFNATVDGKAAAGDEQGQMKVECQAGPAAGGRGVSATVNVQAANVPLRVASIFAKEFGYSLQSGRATLDLKASLDPQRAKSQGKLIVTGLQLKPQEGQAITLDKVSIDHDVTVEDLTSPKLFGRVSVLSSAGGVSIESAGTDANLKSIALKASAKVNLDSLSGLATQALGLSPQARIQGKLDSEVNVKGGWPDIEVSGGTNISGFELKDPKLMAESFREPSLKITHSVAVSGGGRRVSIGDLQIAGSAISARISGTITDLSKLEMDVGVEAQGDLSGARALLGKFMGLPEGLSMAGALNLQAHAVGAGGKWQSTGQMKITGMKLQGGPLGEAVLAYDSVVVSHDVEATVEPTEFTLKTLHASLSPGVEADVQGVLRRGAQAGIEGNLKATTKVDISRLWPVLAKLLSMPAGMSVAGTATSNIQAGLSPAAISAQGSTVISGMTLKGPGAQSQPLAYDRVELAHAVTVDLKKESMEISSLQVTVPAMKLSVKGQVTQLRDPRMDLALGLAADLREGAKALQALGMLPPGVGIEGRADADMTLKGGLLEGRSEGTTRLSGLSLSLPGGPVPLGDMTVQHAVGFSERGNKLAIDKVAVTSPDLTLSVKGSVSNLARQEANLEVAASGNVQRFAGLVRDELKLPAGFLAAGRFDLGTTLNVGPAALLVKGQGSFKDLDVSNWPGMPRFQEKQMTIAHDLSLDRKTLWLEVKEFGVRSSVANVSAMGKVNLGAPLKDPSGEASVDADVALAMPILSQIAGLSAGPTGQGRMTASAKFTAAGKARDFSCKADLGQCALKMPGLIDKPAGVPLAVDLRGSLAEAISVSSGSINFGPLAASVKGSYGLSGPAASRPISAEIAMPRFDVGKVAALVPALSGGVFDGSVALDLSVSGAIAQPMVGVDLQADFANLVVPASVAGGGKPAGKPAEKGPDMVTPLLRGLSGNIALKAKRLAYAQWELTEVSLNAPASKGNVTLKEMRALMNGAQIEIGGSVNAAATPPVFDLKVTVRDAPVDELAAKFSPYGQIFKTRAGADVSLSGKGLDLPSIRDSVDASMRIQLSDGVIAGMDAMPLLKIPGQVLLLLAAPSVRDYRFKGTTVEATVKNGVLSLPKVMLQSEDSFDLGWEGEIDLDGRIRRLNLELKPEPALLGRMSGDMRKVIDFLGGTIIVPVTGSLAKPKPDLGKIQEALLKATLRQVAPEIGNILDLIQTGPKKDEKQ